MNKTNIIAIFGYNNTRIYDVIKIQALAYSQFGAQLLLIKEGINEFDLEVTPYCIDQKPEDPDLSPKIEEYLERHNLKIIGCLPFSDRGVIGAAHASHYFGLFGDAKENSFAMLDKNSFRQLERNLQIDSSVYKKPFFSIAHSEVEVRDIFKNLGPYFIKPTSEGNSRGCMKIESVADLEHWLNDFKGILTKGVICEEILASSNEFSFDGVAGAYWITQKFTTQGVYRAEYQHILPAPLTTDLKKAVHATLQPLLWQLGSRGGAFHHEFFILQDQKLASVEPNRRPAGMWLWDLASWAFKDFNPWTRWLNFCINGQIDPLELEQSGYAGVRGTISEKTGQLASINIEAIQNKLEAVFGVENVRFSLLKEKGSKVTNEPKDNSDFLAFVALKNSNYEDLTEGLDLANSIILENIEVAPCELN